MQAAEARALGAMPYIGLKVLYLALAAGLPTWAHGPLVVRLSWQEDGVDSVLPPSRQLYAQASGMEVRVGWRR